MISAGSLKLRKIHRLLSEKELLFLVLSLLSVSVVFAAAEISHPYFFLNDDNADSYLCQYVYSVRALCHGEFPFYNFNQYMGYEFAAQGQVGVFNPFMYMAYGLSRLIFGHPDATVDIMSLLLILFGTYGSFLFVSRLTHSPEASAIAASGWMLNSFNIYVSECWIVVMITTALFPWMLYSMCLLIDRPCTGRYISSILVHSFAFIVSGHPQFYVCCVIFEVVFSLGLIPFRRICYLLKQLIITYAGVLVLCFPLLFAMYDFMQQSSDRDSRLSPELFVEHTMINFIGIIYPYSSHNGFLSIDESGRFTTDYALFEDVQKNLGFIGYILLFFFILGIIAFIREARVCLRNHKSNPKLKRDGFILLCSFLALIWSSSYLFNNIIYLIPILNRFRYPFKLILFLPPFMTVTAGITIADLLAKHPSKSRMLSYGLLSANIISLALLYVILPVRCISIPLRSDAVPYNANYLEELSCGRYVNFECGQPLYDDDHSHHAVNFPACMTLNIASYFGINDRFGYLLFKTEPVSSVDFNLYNYESGSVDKYYDGFIDDMRSTSVCWYITIPGNKTEVSKILSAYGIVEKYEDADRVVFYDSKAEPIVYSDCSSSGISFEQHINYITINTASDFTGGVIHATYNANPDLHVYVDGIEQPLESDGDSLLISAGKGVHSIIIRYVPPTLELSLLISAVGIAGFSVYFAVSNKRKSGAKQNQR